MRAWHLMGSRSQRPPHRENRKASCMKCMRYSRALRRCLVRPSLRKRLPEVERPGLQVVRPQETSLDGDRTMLQPYKFRCQAQRYLTRLPPPRLQSFRCHLTARGPLQLQ